MNVTEMQSILTEYATNFPPLLTVEQAAAIAARPVGTIYDWSHRGRLDKFKHRTGREIRLLRDQFVRFLLAGDEQAQ